MTTLAYARAPRSWRRHLFRHAVLAATIALAAAAAYRWGPDFYRYSQRNAAQRRMVTHRVPPGTVALTNDPDESRDLLAGKGYVAVPIRHRNDNPCTPDDATAGLAPGAAASLYTSYSLYPDSTYGRTPPTVFLHGRRAPAGGPRLVHVTASLLRDSVTQPPSAWEPLVRGDWQAYRSQEARRYLSVDAQSLWEVRLHVNVYEPASWRPGSIRRPTGEANATRAFVIPNRVVAYDGRPPAERLGVSVAPLRLFAGAPDREDASAFTIAYEVDGVPGVIKGRLGDDDRVGWQLLSGPLAPVPERP